MSHKLRYDEQWVKNAAGIYVQAEPISAALVAGAAEGDVVSVAADGTLECTTPSAGSGAALASPDDPPASPNTEDDEFDSSTLNAKWTEALTGATSDVDTSIPSHYVIKVTGNQSGQITQAYAAAGTFSVTCAFSFLSSEANSLVDLRVTDDTSSTNAVLMRLGNPTQARVDGHNRTSSTNASQGNFAQAYGARHYMHIQRSGTTFSCWYCQDGRGWLRIASFTKTLTIAYLMFAFSASSSTAVRKVALDWIRRDWVTL